MWNNNIIYYNMIYLYGRIALVTFFTSAFCNTIIIFLSRYYFKSIFYLNWIQLVIYGAFCLLIKFVYNFNSYEITVRAFFLGQSFGLGISIYVLSSESWKLFGIYVTVLCTFHLTEFLAIAFTNPSALSSDTFVINHSYAYSLAAGASWIEFLIEINYFSEIKKNTWIPLIGLIFCLIGEVFRKTAIFTAKKNFNHIVQNRKKNNHKLVTHGIYSICRHPSYVGWFYWSVGTQLILQNPLCFLSYALISWKFFHDRIFIEELSLLEFFGILYVEYQKKVSTGLPFIYGYKYYEFD